ncbi:putative membrane protein [Chlamydia ibidis]|uniref:Membrane protein n=2 Tax=Chlamydia ibidis TaxID=1405396 RepID=A0ABN0N0K0_9CHLA|nr:hypothetical protein [Chlamydia ibidis]EPP34361.1 putative membrane protein [Chlamydia ibidis]EQM63156.1 putative membrane protein [Chlamydia ibidis 10-1398/6]
MLQRSDENVLKYPQNQGNYLGILFIIVMPMLVFSVFIGLR